MSSQGHPIIGWARRFMRSRIGFVLGLLMLIGAGVYVFAEPEHTNEFFSHIKNAPAWAIAVIFVGPIVNWICISLSLYSLMRRHGVLGRGEMLALVGAAWLLNHLPMRPGLVGRVGYHAKINRIAIRDSIEASVWSIILAAIASTLALGCTLLMSKDTSLIELSLILLIPAIVFGVGSLIFIQTSSNIGYLLSGFVFRWFDIVIWMIRYAAAFTILGVEVTPVQIAIITAASQVAQLIPITGGGLGFREWGVGIAATMSSGTSTILMRTAIGADVINRVAETLIVIPLGGLCVGWVAKRVAHYQPNEPDLEPQSGSETLDG